MRKFLFRYFLPRIAPVSSLVIFIGVTLTFIIPRLSPNDPVEATDQPDDDERVTVNPEAIIHLREALTEMYGL